MKQRKTNHIETLNSLKAQYLTLTREREAARKVWMANSDRNREMGIYDRYHANDKAIENLEREIKFHTVMLQDKKYATEWLWSDAHAYEIIEELSDTKMTVRRMKATLKPEAKKELNESFEPGGFCGHFDNSLQEWDYESVEDNPIETIRKHKNGKWYATGKRHFTIEAKPYEWYDFNF